MTEYSKKFFADIRDDYAFFEAHTTEFDRDLYHYQQAISQFSIPETPLKFLDFGCGTGVFTSRFLDGLNFPPQSLEITLIEPDEVYRQNAVSVLSNYTQFPIENFSCLPTEIPRPFHLILSNHVLYYVPDLSSTINQLLQALHPQGILLMTMAGKANIISQFWQKCFDWLGKKIPYYLAEDLMAISQDLSLIYQRQTVTYELRFPDTIENRWKLLRFMLGNHLEQLTEYNLPALFDPYSFQSQIDITTSHYQFLFQSPELMASEHL
ncbi:methyltransferase type 12 [Gloeomargarita lithophora Alchichica-D10]|uniref:Methyltransferase type 12 n=1 Tax=Gloeomargarita lithophora Alchichica-D10 TaxID=1188229 RepID=A0A1J0AD31_9CYAN|nr:methyltransferase domain-containing protein [Gloeomargarita lithophora]APB33842.1 methyltransferase type 12 [Gloeomargarita lithophora Alchichica-D10]